MILLLAQINFKNNLYGFFFCPGLSKTLALYPNAVKTERVNSVSFKLCKFLCVEERFPAKTVFFQCHCFS